MSSPTGKTSAGRSASQRLTLSQVSTLTGVLGLVFLIGVAAYMAWNTRRTLFQEGRDRAQIDAYFLSEHAQRLFEVSDIALRSIATATAGKDWGTLEQSPDLLANMREVTALLPYVDVLFLADEHGSIRCATLEGAAKYSVADRLIFQTAAKARTDKMLIGEPIVGRINGKPTFLLARRLEDSDGHFRGIVVVSMSLAYFTEFWERLEKRNDERVAIVRGGSGGVLARYPAARDPEGDQLIGGSLLAAVDGHAVAGLMETMPQDEGYYHRIGDLSAYLSVFYKKEAIVAQWRAQLLTVLPFFAVAGVALASILLIGRRLARREAVNRREIETAQAQLAASNSRLEQRVAERTADLLESNQEIQRFAYIVSHDLRAPLVNIMGFTSELAALKDQIFGTSGPVNSGTGLEAARQDFEEALGFIHSSIDKMDRLIKAILALSRQGQRKLKPEPLDMDALMRSITDGVAHRLMQKAATTTIEALPPLVADRVAIEQIFSNLIDNSVKYLKPGTPGLITVSGTASATTCTYAVRDNGRGIDERDRERVFELFRRAGKQDQPGEGIGLANVRSLVRRLQGTITLDSQLDMGCVFTVTLPKFGADTDSKGVP